MPKSGAITKEALILALPESAGSAVYGMVDVLAATGTLWRELSGGPAAPPLIRPRIVALSRKPFRCGNGIPVSPDLALADASAADIVIVPELWLAPTDDLRDRHPELKEWLRRRYRAGGSIYSACSGAVLLAAAGLLDGRAATSHWGYADLFKRSFPEVRFDPAPNLVVADPAGRIVTAGGTTSWHDLALHIVARHCSPGEALRIAKVYLLKWHAEGQLPYANLVRRQPHADAAVRRAEAWLAAHFRETDAVRGVVEASGIPERSLNRRFKAAVGTTPIAHVQNLRVEAAKQLLETGDDPADGIAAAVGYENPAFFRRLFRRCTGMTPGAYRRMFAPVATAGRVRRR
ncbi:MAG: helix-turn-helix domain-containing protein [Rhodospirillales bacterium]|nr:helix-turn-helix domain-containing protein [Rhodospirillales bacterium]